MTLLRTSPVKRVAVGLLAAVAILSVTAGAGAANLVLTSKMGAATLTAPAFHVDYLTLSNSGTITGRAEKNDLVWVSFQGLVDRPTICSGWPNTTANATVSNAVISINNNAAANGDDTMTVSSVPTTSCSGGVFHLGTIDMGAAGYVTGGVATFGPTTITIQETATTTTVWFQLGKAGGAGTLQTVVSGANALYTPDAAIKQRTTGTLIGLNVSSSTTTVQL